MYVQLDCSLVEIIRLVVTESGDLIALDGTLTSTTNACSAQGPGEYRDLSEKTPPRSSKQHWPLLRQARRQHRLLVNGAGLAMATMDIISSRRRGQQFFLTSEAARTNNKSDRGVSDYPFPIPT